MIVKLDAGFNITLNYLKTNKHFLSDPSIGMVGGFCYVENGD
jgi:hypothetical protein